MPPVFNVFYVFIFNIKVVYHQFFNLSTDFTFIFLKVVNLSGAGRDVPYKQTDNL